MFPDYSKKPRPIWIIYFLGGPKIIRTGSNVGILESSRELLKFFMTLEVI